MKIDEENCCVPLLGFQALTQSLMDNDSNEYLIDCKQETKLVIEKPEGVWSQTDLVSNQIRWNYVNSWLTLRDKREQFEFSLLVGEFAAKRWNYRWINISKLSFEQSWEFSIRN